MMTNCTLILIKLSFFVPDILLILHRVHPYQICQLLVKNF